MAYKDGDLKSLDMSNKRWRSSESLAANLAFFPKLRSFVADVLHEMLRVIVCKFFLLLHAQGIPQHVLYISYESEEEELTKHFNRVVIGEVSFDANVISSQTVCKMKSK